MLPNEDDLVVVVWANFVGDESNQARPFQTIMKSGSRKPVAWRLSVLQERYSGLLPSAHLVFSEADLRSWMSPPLFLTCTRQSPLLVPVSLARSVLAWYEFDVWDEEHDV